MNIGAQVRVRYPESTTVGEGRIDGKVCTFIKSDLYYLTGDERFTFICQVMNPEDGSLHAVDQTYLTVLPPPQAQPQPVPGKPTAPPSKEPDEATASE